VPDTIIGELAEQDLNPRLRRVDWRFLLPVPEPRRVWCIGGQDLMDGVTSIAAEVVSSPSARDCDLAVAEDPDAKILAQLFSTLRPGGACYTEWRVGQGGVHLVDRQLREAGFAEVTCYRPWPAFPRLPVYWIQLGASGAAAYVRSRLRLRGGRIRRLLTGLRDGLWGRGRGGYRATICAIAYRTPDPRRKDLDPVGWLEHHWAEWGLGAIPARLSTVLVTGGPRTVSKVVLLAFAEPSPIPVIAIKAPRVDAATPGILRESDALATLTGPASPRVVGIPRLLFRRELGRLTVIGETAIAGRPLDSLLDRRSLPAWSMKVTDWLASLAKQRPTRPAAYWQERIVDPVLSRFIEHFGAVVDPGLLRESETMVRSIGSLPSVPEQRDFGPWNLLVTPAGQLAVLDWESAEVEGLPALDLLYYLAYACFNVDRAHDFESRVRSYRRSLDPSSLTGVVRGDSLSRYLDVLGIQAGALAPLRVLVWLIHAHSDFVHAASDAAGSPSAAALKRSLFLALWEKEVRLARR
jgi:hypothetical protein